jgi:hypothetical protein
MLPWPGSPAVPTYSPHGSSRTRFDRFATIVSCASLPRQDQAVRLVEPLERRAGAVA